MIFIILFIAGFGNTADEMNFLAAQLEKLHRYKNSNFPIFPFVKETTNISFIERYYPQISSFHQEEISHIIRRLSFKLKPDWNGHQHRDLLEEGIDYFLRDKTQGIKKKFLNKFFYPHKVKTRDEFLTLLFRDAQLQAQVTKKIAKSYSKPGLQPNIVINKYTSQALFILNNYYYLFDFNKKESKLKISKVDHYEDDAILTFSVNEDLDAMAMIVVNECSNHLYAKISFRPSVQLEPLHYKKYIDCLWITNDDLLLITLDYHTHIFNRKKKIIKDLIPLHIKLLIKNNIHNNTIDVLNLFDERETLETSYIFKIAEFANPVVHKKLNFEFLDEDDEGISLFE